MNKNEKTGPKRVTCFLCKREVTKRKTKGVARGERIVRVCRTHPVT